LLDTEEGAIHGEDKSRPELSRRACPQSGARKGVRKGGSFMKPSQIAIASP
jgi:hypothetical protein